MTSEDRKTLLALARQYWEEAEATVYAYARHYHKVARHSKALKVGTVILAVFTAVTALRPEASWLTVIVAMLTAFVAAVEQHFAPTAMAQQFWECKTKLEAIKRDIVSYSLALARDLSFEGGAEPLTQASTRIGDATQVPVELMEEDYSRAHRAFRNSVIYLLISRADESAEGDTAPESIGLPDDVPDIIPVTRSTAAQPSR